MKVIKVSLNDANQRIDKYLKRVLPSVPANFLYKLFRKKDIKVNGKWVKENFHLNGGEKISVYISDVQYEDFTKTTKLVERQTCPFEIVYEDENMLVVNKPAGILVHGDEEEKKKTLINIVTNYLYGKGEYEPNKDSFAPSLVHRLDRNTSGLVMIAKNYRALSVLLDALNNKEKIKKTYLALVKGVVAKEFTYEVNLVKNSRENKVYVDDSHPNRKKAITYFAPNKKFTNYSLIEATLLTGRTHQIRVSLASVDHPIIGDDKYGDFALNHQFKKTYNLSSIFLHAYSLSFAGFSDDFSYLNGLKLIAKLPLEKVKIIEELEKKSAK